MDYARFGRLLDQYQVIMRLVPKSGSYRDGELQVIGHAPIGVLAAYELWKDFERHARLDGRTAPLTGSMAELVAPRLDDIILDAPDGDDVSEGSRCGPACKGMTHTHATVDGY